uniref:Putative transposase n=2 Tax=Ignatiaceae TaxID=2682551 RepID=A0A1W6EGW0_9CHLO|nr:putative transposase [Pseudocharacium americanum]YP_009367739.1 putative transposase [Ignatius tetrasporus]ARK14637.1 putative transposase [Pseudocharacium americanum]ARK14726.1 putative transposase [Ignatius tetrasporus]
MGYPKFKSKKNSIQSYTSQNNKHCIRLVDNQIRFPKLGFFKFANLRKVTGKIIKAPVRCNPAGKYFVTVLADVNIELKLKNCRKLTKNWLISGFLELI